MVGKWKRDSRTVKNLIEEQLNNHGGTVEHLIMEQ